MSSFVRRMQIAAFKRRNEDKVLRDGTRGLAYPLLGKGEPGYRGRVKKVRRKPKAKPAPEVIAAKRAVRMALKSAAGAQSVRPVRDVSKHKSKMLYLRQQRSAPRATVSGNVAIVNRHTGEPHAHDREVSRRLRQQARLS